jgi:hypothetical protein
VKAKDLNVQDILSSASKGKLVIKLPKVLNKATGKETNVPFLFSAANCGKATKSFIKSIRNKPAGYVETITNMARATLRDVNAETPLSSFDEDSDEDIRALICEHPSFTLHPTDPHRYRILFTCVHWYINTSLCEDAVVAPASAIHVSYHFSFPSPGSTPRWSSACISGSLLNFCLFLSLFQCIAFSAFSAFLSAN